MKTTPFTHFHEELGARMAPFAGYNMPIEYTGIKDEHNTVREKLGVFDVSHMGEFWVKARKLSNWYKSLLLTMWLLSRMARFNIAVSRMKREVSWMTFWYIVSALRNICWL